ncbi:hypothetical protein L7F22_017040 [Adiantum nelumboides]|nr:hypothetical protein [Adiantum nelumboides]
MDERRLEFEFWTMEEEGRLEALKAIIEELYPGFTVVSIQERHYHDPSLQFANMMWFKGPYNTQIFVGENEPADSVVKRFRRAVMQAGVIAECRRRRFFETPQAITKRKLQAAQRRRSKS